MLQRAESASTAARRRRLCGAVTAPGTTCVTLVVSIIKWMVKTDRSSSQNDDWWVFFYYFFSPSILSALFVIDALYRVIFIVVCLGRMQVASYLHTLSYYANICQHLATVTEHSNCREFNFAGVNVTGGGCMIIFS